MAGRSDRAHRWFQFSTGANEVQIAGNSILVIDVAGLAEVAADREFEAYTVKRLIFQTTLFASASQMIITYGLNIDNENVSGATIDPASSTQADWLYWEEVMIGTSTLPLWAMYRDVSTLRKLHGLESVLRLKVSNRDLNDAVTCHAAGRVLVQLS